MNTLRILINHWKTAEDAFCLAMDKKDKGKALHAIVDLVVCTLAAQNGFIICFDYPDYDELISEQDLDSMYKEIILQTMLRITELCGVYPEYMKNPVIEKYIKTLIDRESANRQAEENPTLN
jgi:hypothetical protein